MLERASSCLEPAAQNLFRSIEAPTRSQRRLPQAFWRHARNTQERSSWWSAYLDDIRRATQAREGGNEATTLSQRLATGVLPFMVQQWSLAETGNVYSKQKAYPANTRHISKVVKQSRNREEKAFEEALEPEDESPPPAEVALFAPEGIPEPRKLRSEVTAAQRLEELLRAGGEPNYNAVWVIFISLKEQAGFARAVLRYLSRSSSPVILKRALRTFQMIEVEDRTHLTYESGVRAAIGLRKYAATNAFILEALQRNLGVESSQLFMGHLIENGIWRSAIQALKVFVENRKLGSEKQTITNQHVLQHVHEGPIWKTVDGMLSLPQKLITLSERLKQNDPVFASDRADIEHLATRLLERAFRSTTIMGIITPNGVLALLDSFRGLGLLRLEHYLDALSALRVLRETRNRSELALLIFRNMRWRYPTHRFNRSTYGTMISILSSAPNEPEAFEYILRDVSRAHEPKTAARKLDLAMYQRTMSACAELGHTTYVGRLLQRLIHDHGVPRDLAYFTPVLLSSAKHGDVVATRKSFDELSSRYGLTPSTQCWNVLLLAYAKADDFEGAAALFRQMTSLGVPADAYTFGTLMTICSNAGDTQALLQLVDMARKQRIPASMAMIDTIVHSYCMNEEVEEAESLVEAATQMSLSGSPTRMWNILLRHYAFRADSNAVLRTQERMRELAVKPDGMTYAALMTSLVIIGKTKDAAAILRSLHLSQVVTASRFQYSIVLHGYVREGQRDQAVVIYTEMLERFGRPSPSAQLAMLRLQSQRDELQAQLQGTEGAAKWAGRIPKSASLLQSRTIDFLADVLLEMDDSEGLSNEPQPGFQRRKPLFGAAGAFLEVPVALLSLSSSYEKAQKLIGRYKAVIDASSMSKQQKSHRTAQLLTAQLRGLVKSYEGSGKSTVHLKKQSQDRIDKIWSSIFAQTFTSARERRLELMSDESSEPDHTSVSAQDSVSAMEGSLRETDLLSEQDSRIGNDGLVSLAQKVANIIPAKRYALSIPLSVYMRGLALQKRLPELESLLNRVQEAGFELTSKNWNTYVQLLSEKEESVLKAFRIFEKNLLLSTPPWALLKRGKVSSSLLGRSLITDADPSEDGKTSVTRRTVEKRRPGQLVPSYFTVIHLAAAFIKAYHARFEEGDHDKLSLYDELRGQAPGTVKYIQAMPLLKDRTQGVLLRGRAVKGDFDRRAHEPQLVDRAGLLGSRSLLATFSSEQLDMLDRYKETEHELQSVLMEIQGPVVEGPLITARRRLPESEEVQAQRLRSQEKKQDSLRQKVQTELQENAAPLIASDVSGEPHVRGLPVVGDHFDGPHQRETAWPGPQEQGTPVPMATYSPMATQSESQLWFEKSVENLRRTAVLRERTPPHWRIRSTRRRQKAPRIIAFPSKPDPMLLLKPMSNYTHKDHVFTKPMLTMRVPRRRQLGSERRAFDLPKKYMDLKRERERSIRKAQARARKLGLKSDDFRDQQAIEPRTHEVAQEDAEAFLEERLVGRESSDAGPLVRDASGSDAQVGMSVGEPAQGQQHSSPASDTTALPASTQEDTKAMKRALDDTDHAVDAADSSFLQTRLVNSIPAENAAKTSNEQDAFLPWGGLGQFGEKDFVRPQDASKGR